MRVTILERRSRWNVMTRITNPFHSNMSPHLCNSTDFYISAAGSESPRVIRTKDYFTPDDYYLSDRFRYLWSEWVTVNKITKWGMICVKFEIALCSCGKLVGLLHVWVLVLFFYCVCRRCVHPWRKGPFFHPPVGCSGLWNCAPWTPYGSSPAGRWWVSYSCSLVSY